MQGATPKNCDKKCFINSDPRDIHNLPYTLYTSVGLKVTHQ